MDMEDSGSNTQRYVRSLGDVQSMINHAKLNEKNLTEITQTLYFSVAKNVDSDFKLLEVNPHILSAIEENQTVCFKGGLSDKVVLCTDSKTFEIKEAEISNSLLLISDLGHAQTTSKSPIKSPQGAVNRSLDKSTNSNDDSTENIDENATIGNQRALQERLVLKVFHEYLECREIRPRLRKLNDLLMLTRYTGPENEYCIERSLLFTRDQLLNTIQCSRMEFEAGIHLYRVIEIGGRLRILDCEYEYRILSLMVNIIAEMGWALDEIERDATIELLVPNIAPAEIVTGLFDLYTKPTEGKTQDNGQLLFGYCEELVCKIIAQNILQQGMKFHINDFMTTWQNALPDGMKINEGYLKGIGIIDADSSSVPCVRSLIESDLSINLYDRLKVLFKTKEKWTLDQIEPYIEYFSTPKLTVTSILAKHARSMTFNGQRVYVAKHS